MDIRSFFAPRDVRSAPALGSGASDVEAELVVHTGELLNYGGHEQVPRPLLGIEALGPHPDGAMIAKLQTAFESKKAKDITVQCLQAIQDAQCDSQLQTFQWIMHDYKSNTFGPQKRRLDAWTPDTNVAVASPVLPKGIRRALEAKRQRLNDNLRSSTHGGVAAQSSNALEPTEVAITSSSAESLPSAVGIHNAVAADSSQSAVGTTGVASSSHSDVPITNASSEEVVGEDTGTAMAADPAPSAVTSTQLANIFQVSEEKITKMRKKGSLYSLIDIAMLVTDANKNDAGAQIRRVIERYPNLSRSLAFIQFGGRGQRPTPAADALTLAKFMLRLPNADPGKCMQAAHLLGKMTGYSAEDITAACQEPLERTQKFRDEDAVGRILQRLEFEYIPQFTIADKRVDFMITTDWGRILLEVDEKQHKNYGLPSEVARTCFIQDWALQQNGSTVLVRFNPDKFSIDGKDVSTTWKTRADTLTTLLQDAQATKDVKSFEIIFLYYDMDADGKPCLLADPHVPDAIRKLTRIYLLDSSQSVVGTTGVASSSHSDVPITNASSEEVVGEDTGTVMAANPAPSAVTSTQLAGIFKVAEEKVTKMRKKGSLYSLIDITMIVTHNDARYAAKEITILGQRYPEVWNKIQHLKFPGRGQRETPVGDIYTVVEFIMLLPGKRAGLIRSEASRLFVKFHGGDLSLVDEVIARREDQDTLRLEAPAHPARAFGEEVEDRTGTTDEQMREMEMQLAERQEASTRMTSYDPLRMSEEHHQHKDEMNDKHIEGLEQVHGDLSQLTRCVAVLDDFDRENNPRTSSALVKAGIPPERIISPNREQCVVNKLQDMGVRTKGNGFEPQMGEPHRSYFEPTRPRGKRVGTHFWIRGN
jgi:hypothetical protein